MVRAMAVLKLYVAWVLVVFLVGRAYYTWVDGWFYGLPKLVKGGRIGFYWVPFMNCRDAVKLRSKFKGGQVIGWCVAFRDR